MTASKHLNKKDNKLYIHLDWYQDGKRKPKCIGTGLTVIGNKKLIRQAEEIRIAVLNEWQEKVLADQCELLFSEY